MSLLCFSCNKEVETRDGKVGLREECPHCHADAHACKNCQFYDPKVYNECKESSADRVKEKDRANYCDYFQVRVGLFGSVQNEKDKLMSAAEALFRKK